MTHEQLTKTKKGPFSPNPFLEGEENGGRHKLLETVMGYVTDVNFREPIVIQGSAGSGKSTFTLRLADHLLPKASPRFAFAFAMLSSVRNSIRNSARRSPTKTMSTLQGMNDSHLQRTRWPMAQCCRAPFRLGAVVWSLALTS